MKHVYTLSYICPSRSSTHARQCVFRHALLRMRVNVFSVTLFYACARVMRGRDADTSSLCIGWMADGNKLHDQRQRIYSEPCMGRERINLHTMLFTARGISLRTLHIPSNTLIWGVPSVSKVPHTLIANVNTYVTFVTKQL